MHVGAARYPDGGGVEVLMAQTCAELARFAPLKFVFLGSSAGPSETGTDSHGVHFMNAPHYSLLRRILELQVAVRRWSPRVMHIHYLDALGSAAVEIAKQSSIPYLIHVHGIWSGLNSRSVKRILADTRHIVAPSNAVKEALIKLLGVDREIDLVINGVKDPRQEIVSTTTISPSVALVGRHSSEKGFDWGLRSLAPLVRKFPDLQIHLAGVGPMTLELKELAAGLGLESNTKFWGPLSHRDALQVISMCDVLLVPSQREEGFSLVAIEAALLEKPVVATRVGGLIETVVDGETGILVSPDDWSNMGQAIEQLLNYPKLRNIMGEKSRSRALEIYGIERFSNEIFNVYCKILNKTPRATAVTQCI